MSPGSAKSALWCSGRVVAARSLLDVYSLCLQYGFNNWLRDRQRQLQERQRSKRKGGGKSHKPRAGSAANSASGGGGGGATEGCPLRRMGGLGKPLGGIIALAADRQMKCPTAIVQVPPPPRGRVQPLSGQCASADQLRAPSYWVLLLGIDGMVEPASSR